MSDDPVSNMLRAEFERNKASGSKYSGTMRPEDQDRLDASTRALERSTEILKLVISQRDEALAQRAELLTAARAARNYLEEQEAKGKDTPSTLYNEICAAIDLALNAVKGVTP